MPHREGAWMRRRAGRNGMSLKIRKKADQAVL